MNWRPQWPLSLTLAMTLMCKDLLDSDWGDFRCRRAVESSSWQCSCHRIILKFSGVITIDRHDVYAKGQCQRSKVNVTEVMTPYSRIRTITPVWIHIWLWYDAQSFMLLRRGTMLFLKVIHQISRSHLKKSSILTQIGHFQTVTPVGIHHWLLNDAQRLKQHRRGVLLFFKVICQFSR